MNLNEQWIGVAGASPDILNERLQNQFESF
jgi:hypothetical protein